MLDFKLINDRVVATLTDVTQDKKMIDASPEVQPGVKFATVVLKNNRHFQSLTYEPTGEEEKLAFINTYTNLKKKLTGEGRVKQVEEECFAGIFVALSKMEFILVDQVMLSSLSITDKLKIITNFRYGDRI